VIRPEDESQVPDLDALIESCKAITEFFTNAADGLAPSMYFGMGTPSFFFSFFSFLVFEALILKSKKLIDWFLLLLEQPLRLE
jgi:hypothetical protein